MVGFYFTSNRYQSSVKLNYLRVTYYIRLLFWKPCFVASNVKNDSFKYQLNPVNFILLGSQLLTVLIHHVEQRIYFLAITKLFENTSLSYNFLLQSITALI